MVDLLYLITLVPTVLLSSLRSDDDMFDKINYKYTGALLVLFATITASRQFDDDRIECWNRANFIKPYIQYTNEICYISSTYYVDKNRTIPQSFQERTENKLNYYQWTPFIILLMAFFFYLPRFIWRALSVRSGIDLLDIVEAADDTKSAKKFDDRDELIKFIVGTIDMYVDDARRQNEAEKRQTSLLRKLFQLVCCMTGKFLGNYFVSLYMFIKVHQILNVILQIWLLNVFLGKNFLRFGYERVKLFRYGLNQPESVYFPRETYCDFFVREPLRGGEPLQRITVQCVLTVNLFNQQIFTILWLWFMIVFLLNIYSLILWIGRLGSYNNRYQFIYTRLARTSRENIPRFRFDFKHSGRELGDHVHESLVQAFINDYLEADGFFFIRMLTVNVSDFVVQEIIEQLWACYVMKYGEGDAQKAEKMFNASRGRDGTSPPTTPMELLQVPLLEGDHQVSDAKRKYFKQLSNVGTNVLRTTNALDAMKTTAQQSSQPPEV